MDNEFQTACDDIQDLLEADENTSCHVKIGAPTTVGITYAIMHEIPLEGFIKVVRSTWRNQKKILSSMPMDCE